jgi:hypothetical protein
VMPRRGDLQPPLGLKLSFTSAISGSGSASCSGISQEATGRVPPRPGDGRRARAGREHRRRRPLHESHFETFSRGTKRKAHGPGSSAAEPRLGRGGVARRARVHPMKSAGGTSSMAPVRQARATARARTTATPPPWGCPRERD